MKIRDDRYYNVVKESEDGELEVGYSLYLDDDEVVVTDNKGAVWTCQEEELGDGYELEEDDTMEMIQSRTNGDYTWVKKEDRDIEYVDAESDTIAEDIN